VVFRPEDRVFSTITGEPAKSLYQAMIEEHYGHGNTVKDADLVLQAPGHGRLGPWRGRRRG